MRTTGAPISVLNHDDKLTEVATRTEIMIILFIISVFPLSLSVYDNKRVEFVTSIQCVIVAFPSMIVTLRI